MSSAMALSSSSPRSSSETAFRLVGELDGRPITFVLSSTVMTIGAHPGNEMVMIGPGISRRHAVLSVTPDGVIVEDQESKNGTWINGRRSALAKILPGDELALGAATLTLEQVHPEDAQVALVFDSDTPSDPDQAITGTRHETDLWVRETDLSTQEERMAAPLLTWLDDLTVRLASDRTDRLESTLEAIAARLGVSAAALIALPPGEEVVWTTTWGSFEYLREQVRRHETQLRDGARDALRTRAWRLESLSAGFVGITPVARNEAQLLVLTGGDTPDGPADEPLVRFSGHADRRNGYPLRQSERAVAHPPAALPGRLYRRARGGHVSAL